MVYRTKTYIAADWDNDQDAVNKLHEWNDNDYWSFSFHDAHQLKQARDTSLPCSIKRSLKDRMDASKTFILIVGDHTVTVTKGSCQYCASYNSYWKQCSKWRTTDLRSFIKYECDKALEANINIVVLYKSTTINKNKCPLVLRDTGSHVAMWYRGADGNLYWNYRAIKQALEQ